MTSNNTRQNRLFNIPVLSILTVLTFLFAYSFYDCVPACAQNDQIAPIKSSESKEPTEPKESSVSKDPTESKEPSVSKEPSEPNVSTKSVESEDPDIPKRPIVWFVHGMISIRDSFSEELETLRAIYPNAQSVELKTWDAPKMNPVQIGTCWSVSLVNAQKVPEQLFREIEALSLSDRDRLILTGHSLGGRIVVKTAALCKQKRIRVRQIILAGAALNNDDPDISSLPEVSRERVVNIVNPSDIMLAAYKQVEGSSALGTGYLYPMNPNRFTETLLSNTVAHYGYLYLKKFQKCVEIDDFTNKEIIVPQDYSQLDMPTMGGKIWWDVLDSCQGWRLQHNQATGYCRILDPSGTSRAWGRQYRMEAAFKRVRQQIDVPQTAVDSDVAAMDLDEEAALLNNTSKEERILAEQAIQVMQDYPNWDRATEGGHVFWNELDRYQDWKLQQNVYSGHCRILDPSDVRRAWGTVAKMKQSFEKVKQDLRQMSTILDPDERSPKQERR